MEFMGLTDYGLVYSLAVGLLLWAGILYMFKGARSRHGIIASLAIALIVGFLFLGPWTAPLVQGLTPVQLTTGESAIKSQAVTGNLKLCFYDPINNVNLSSGSVYLMVGGHGPEDFDKIKSGELQAAVDYYVMNLDSSGCVTFRSMTGYTIGGQQYTWFYGGDSVNGYPFAYGTVVAYGKNKDTGLLEVKGGDIAIYKYSDIKMFDPTGATRTGYTSASLSLDLTTKIGPSEDGTAVSNVYLYASYDSSVVTTLEVYINGQKVDFEKVSELDATSPLKKNAGSYTYVSTQPVFPDLLQYNENNRPDMRIKVEATGNTTITFAPVMNANVEYGDTPVGTLTVTIDTSATSGYTGS